MIGKINRIKGLGLVFSDFTWNQEVQPFKKVNLIYGWNGCGKTTLTRLFYLLSTGDTEGVQFELEDDVGGKLSQGQLPPFPVKVFNQDYISRNISVLKSTANTISILLGDENKELAEQVWRDEAALNGDGDKIGLLKQITELEKANNRRQKTIDKSFTDIAKIIGAAIMGSSAASRTYRAPNAKSDFEKLDAKTVLSEEELNDSIKLLRQDVLSELEALAPPIVEYEQSQNDVITRLERCSAHAQRLFAQTVDAVAIERLTANPDIADWVGTGTNLHVQHKSKSCEYCGNDISSDRLKKLAAHFNEADRQIKSDLDGLLGELRTIFSALNRWGIPDPARLYPELQETFRSAKVRVEQALEVLTKEVEVLGKSAKEKQLATTQSKTLTNIPNLQPIIQAIEATNAEISKHNSKTKEFDKRQKAALFSIKTHFLSTIKDDVMVEGSKLGESNEQLDKIRAEVTETKSRLDTARAQISSTHKACEIISNSLHAFLGRNELTFVPAESQDETGKNQGQVQGYQILRHGDPATKLSEGEKTAIALMYFLVHLKDGQTELSDTLVVIDDPISSLDTNSLYQAFSFLKNAVKDCDQVFILTHNFDFLRQLLNWRSRQKNRTGYYMIKNAIVNGRRIARICELDETLKSYETEYLFLFKTLWKIKNEQDGSIAAVYPVPNMARKLWESFLMFRVPIGSNTYSRMEVLKNEGFDHQKLDAIYKYTNDQSHISGAGLDPALVPETEKALEAIFDTMEKAAPQHFKLLEQDLIP